MRRVKPSNLIIIPLLIISFLLFFGVNLVNAQSMDDELKILKDEIMRLNQRVEDLEKQRAQDKLKTQEIESRQAETEEQVSSVGSYVDKRIKKFGLFNTTNTLLTGYGALGFSKADGDPSTFSALFAPIFHYRVTDYLHVIIEPEFELEDDELEINLEIGQADLFIGDYLTLSGGKMILPFNAFSQRFHPTWINKMPSLPLMYGHGGHGGQGIVPILSDIGVGISGGVPLNIFKDSKINYAFYLVNGPRIESEDGHDDSEGEEAEGEHEGEEAEDEHANQRTEDEHGDEELEQTGQTNLVFGNNFTDINSNKAFGGRIGFLPIWNWEVGGSFMFGDAEDNIDFFMYGFDTEFQYRGFAFLGEFLHLENDNIGGGKTKKDGFYVQGSYRLYNIPIQSQYISTLINGLEPVLRYGKNYLPEQDQEQFAIGLDWWLLPSVPFKIAYEFNDGLPDRFLVQWAFGF